MGVNYGLNKVRFPSPVPVGAKVRARTTLLSFKEIKGGLQIINQVTIEIEGQDKPGCVAETVSLLYF
jgi:acyl dehydratase